MFTCVGVSLSQHHFERSDIAVRWQRGGARVSFALTTLLPGEDTDETLPFRFVGRVQAFRTGSTRAVAESYYHCRVERDSLAGLYRAVRPNDEQVFESLMQALNECAMVTQFEVGEASDYDAHRGVPVFFSVEASLFRVSPNRCEDIAHPGSDTFIAPLVRRITRSRLCGPSSRVAFRSITARVPNPPATIETLVGEEARQ